MGIAFRFMPFGAACLAAASVPADAQKYDGSPAAKLIDGLIGGPRWGSVKTFDVAGVRLGMSPDEARAALRKAGFTPAIADPDQDAWSAVVSQRAADRIGGKVDQSKVPMFTRAKGLQGETVEAWYATTRDGAQVVEVKYQMPASRMDRTAFTRATVAKYSLPTFEEGSKGIYCTKPETVCASYEKKALPYLLVEPGFASLEIELMVGQRYQEERKASLAAAVEAAAPRDAKASF